MRTKAAALLLSLVAATQASTAIAGGSSVNALEGQKELALFQCLQTNYKSIGVAITDHDWSQFSPRYQASRALAQNFEWQSKLSDFVNTKVQDYHNAELSLKAEGHKPPFTHIFSRCMAFYKSSELHQFLRSNLPK
jgi:hypothetical protein